MTQHAESENRFRSNGTKACDDLKCEHLRITDNGFRARSERVYEVANDINPSVVSDYVLLSGLLCSGRVYRMDRLGYTCEAYDLIAAVR